VVAAEVLEVVLHSLKEMVQMVALVVEAVVEVALVVVLETLLL
jgi:hypothetical protein